MPPPVPRTIPTGRVLPPLVKQMDIVTSGFLADDQFVFPFTALCMNGEQYTIALHVDHESSHFEIIAHRFVQQAARMQNCGVIH